VSPRKRFRDALAPLIAAILVALAARPALAEEASAEPWYGKSPLGVGILADLIREGDIDVGKDFTVRVGGRFHRVHAKLMAIECGSCHAGVSFPEDLQYLRREEFPIAAYPGAVDRGICLGCHRGVGAVATPFYTQPGS
jgi:hypothetical protein